MHVHVATRAMRADAQPETHRKDEVKSVHILKKQQLIPGWASCGWLEQDRSTAVVNIAA